MDYKLPTWLAQSNRYQRRVDRIVNLASGVSTKIVDDDGRRVLFTVSYISNGGIPLVTPVSLTSSLGMVVGTVAGIQFYKYEDYGILVNGPWYCLVAAAAAVTVSEVYYSG